MKKIFVFLFLINLNISSKVIIWDLQNILFKTNNFKAFLNVGLPTQFLSYKFNTGRELKTLQTRTFDVLDHIYVNNSKELPEATENGRVLPLCMRSWLAGLTSGYEIIDKASDVICQLDQEGFFSAEIEKKLILNTIRFMFDSNLLPYSIQPIPSAARVLKRYYNRGNQMFVLSNWAADGFENLYNNPKNRSIFKYFDKNHVIISGKLGIIKPDPAIFKYVINKYNLNPEDCIFIDNDILNINSAKSVGMDTILVENRNISSLKRGLEALGA